MKNILLVLLIILTTFNPLRAQQPLKEKDRAAILLLLETQRQEWNKGNIDGYMQGYWKSDSLKFIGKSGITYGWEATRQKYISGFPDKEAMGELFFDILTMEQAGK